MKVFAATLALLVSNAAAAQDCQTCSMAVGRVEGPGVDLGAGDPAI